MYEAFFSLEDSPFVLTPDPRFLLRSKGHHEVLSTLLYGITSQKGVMALIGDVGTGKTTLCRALVRELPRDVQSALVLNPHLSDEELVGTILDDLGVERRGTTKGELMTQLNQHLLATGAEGKTVVVILDEAQQMSVEALEQIRILSTLETATRKLLQILLAGQPELEDKLGRRDLRQLNQRIGIRCYLKPLSRKDTFRYVEHRLRVAGLPGAVPFTRSGLLRVYKYSGGIPRLINMVCDRALTAAFSARAREVTPALIRTAIRNLEGERRGSRRRPGAGRGVWWRRLAIGATAALLVAAAGAGVAWREMWTPPLVRLVSPAGRPPPVPAAAVPEPPRGAAVTAADGSAASAPAAVDRPGPAPLDEPGEDERRAVVARAVRLWGVEENLSPAVLASWPVDAGGQPDLPAIAERYQLSATLLPQITLAQLRAIDLPAVLELDEGGRRRSYLLRALDEGGALLVGPGGAERRVAAAALSAAWAGEAWVIWRNVDLLPAAPHQALTPTVIATIALRLQKLGHLAPPLPGGNSERFQQGVRRFQREMGLYEDGIVGPRTTLALARVVGGRFSPSLGGSRAP